MEGPVEPPRAELIRWLRINLTLTMTIVGAVSAMGGALVTGTWRVASWDNRINKIEEIGHQHTERLDKAEVALNDRRIELVIDLGQITARLGIVEQQTKFLGAFVQDNFSPKGSGRR